MPVRIHDLLQIDARQFLDAHGGAPRWVGESLRRTPFAVVRRGTITADEIPIGVRGMERNERWAGICHPGWVNRVVTPTQLLRSALHASCAATWPAAATWRSASPSSRAEVLPALRSLAILAERECWKHFDCPWGPGGSAGFELATAQRVMRPQSDLDVVIYAERRLSLKEARDLRDCAAGLPAAVDIRVETPLCGFSLLEYASRGPAAILLRTASGVLLGADPWDAGLEAVQLGAMTAPSSVSPGASAGVDVSAGLRSGGV